MEDQSGLEPQAGDWMADAAASPTLKALLVEIGRVYAPVMLANARAVADGAAQVEAEVDGRRWTQAPFTYQAKTLGWLRQSYGRLDEAARAMVDRLLVGTGCEALFGYS